MIVVLDTNALISALLSPSGPPAEIVGIWEQEEFDLATSPQLLAELQAALAYESAQKDLKRTSEQVEAFLKRLSSVSIFVEPQFTLEMITEDPDDNRVLECAVAAEASYIVSGDKHLLDLKTYQGIRFFPQWVFWSSLKWRKKEIRCSSTSNQSA